MWIGSWPLLATRAHRSSRTFTYDWEGNLLSEQDFNGHIHTYEYDRRNRLTKMTDPLGRGNGDIQLSRLKPLFAVCVSSLSEQVSLGVYSQFKTWPTPA
jgi:YD repeat-containing protein